MLSRWRWLASGGGDYAVHGGRVAIVVDGTPSRHAEVFGPLGLRGNAAAPPCFQQASTSLRPWSLDTLDPDPSYQRPRTPRLTTLKCSTDGTYLKVRHGFRQSSNDLPTR